MPIHSKLKSLEPRRTQFQKKITLLSGGFTKPDSFPNGEITVYPWDASIDDWLAERARKGDQSNLLYQLCAQVCDLNGCPIDNFVVGDINTVLLVSRSIRYNSVIEYDSECPGCGFVTQERIVVPDELRRVGEKGSDYAGWDEVALPDCGDVVRVRPLLVRDEKHISARDDTDKKLISDHVIHIITPIVSINDGSPDSKEEVMRWFNAISPRDATVLEAFENENYPHLDTSIPHQCDRCRKKYTHALDFSADFFRPSLKSGGGAALASEAGPGVERAGNGDQPQRSA